jgi:hypothetical protein
LQLIGMASTINMASETMRIVDVDPSEARDDNDDDELPKTSPPVRKQQQQQQQQQQQEQKQEPQRQRQRHREQEQRQQATRRHGVVPAPEDFGLSAAVEASAWGRPREPPSRARNGHSGTSGTAVASSALPTKAPREKSVHERYDFGPTARSHVLARKTGHEHPADWDWQQCVILF